MDIIMTESAIARATVLDLVPFGNPGSTPEFFALRLTPPEWPNWKPGQFIMLRPAKAGKEHLWARPFSICRLTARDLVIFFQVRGVGTREMAEFSAGEQVDIWGPLGNTMAMEKDTPTLLIAGGIGIAPFVGYAHAHPAPWNLQMEFGHRHSLDCYPFDALNEKIMIDAHHDRGPADTAAFVELLDKRVAEYAAQKGLVLGCGPTGLLKEVRRLAKKHGARTQLSLETRMACGIGACLGCVVKAKADGADDFSHVQTCTCGPNFWADKVEF